MSDLHFFRMNFDRHGRRQSVAIFDPRRDRMIEITGPLTREAARTAVAMLNLYGRAQ